MQPIPANGSSSLVIDPSSSALELLSEDRHSFFTTHSPPKNLCAGGKMALLSRLVTIAAVFLTLFLSASAQLIDAPEVQEPSGSAVEFYQDDCPRARAIVALSVANALRVDKGLPAELLRLHINDCFVRGCDASILLESNQTNRAEKDGVGNAYTLRGYEFLDEVKAQLEDVCPGVVSCADLITLAARDAIANIGGPSWGVVSGRRDGFTSIASETWRNLAPPYADYWYLLNRYQRKGFTEKEMVVLQGRNTIGVAQCGVIQSRLYNSSGPGGVDPTLNPAFAAELKEQCPFGDVMNQVFLDPTLGGYSFDSNYFKRVEAGQGVLTSDAALITTASGRALVAEQGQSPRAPFFQDFADAMEKMSNVQVLVAPKGEIRRNCAFVN